MSGVTVAERTPSETGVFGGDGTGILGQKH
jgi:hypothetical protein